jgi:Bacterial cell division membrane protein
MPVEQHSEEKGSNRIDYGILFSVLMLALFSIVAVYVATSHDSSATSSPVRAVIMQIAWYTIGAIAVVVIMQFDVEQLWKIAPYAYGAGIFYCWQCWFSMTNNNSI